MILLNTKQVLIQSTNYPKAFNVTESPSFKLN